METTDGATVAEKNSTAKQNRAKRPNKRRKKAKIVDKVVANGQTDDSFTPDESFLKENHVIQMEKLVQNSRPGVYKCTLCMLFIDSMENILHHIKEENHIFNVEKFTQIMQFKLLEEPAVNILIYLDLFLEKTVSAVSLQPSDHENRLKLVAKINNIIRFMHSDWSVELYGSSMTGYGLKDANVNLNLAIPNEDIGQGIFELLALFQSVSFARDVKLDFGSNLPRIKFTDVDLHLECELSLNDNNSVTLSHLLAQYQNTDKRFRQLVILFRYWAKVCGVDRADIGMLSPYALDVLVVYYLLQLKKPLLPVLRYREKDKCFTRYQNWRGKNELTLAQLWRGLFKYYALEINLREITVSLATRAVLKRKPKNWSLNILFIEEPGSSKRNLGNTLVKNISYRYLQNCLGETYKYFSTPQTNCGPLFSHICPEGDLSQSQIEEKDSIVKKLLEEDARFKLLQGSDRNVIDSDICKSLVLTPLQATRLSADLQDQYLKYDFSQQNFTGGMDIPLLCISCHEVGHVSLDCTKGLVPLENLPARSTAFFQMLSNVCQFIERKLAITTEEIEERKRIVKELECYISSSFPHVNLKLFGSTFNGFGLKNSDLDICLTFLFNANKGFTVPNLINKLVAHLKRCTMVSNLLPITTARVPIVKFTHCESQLDGDISIYNVLAQRNTKMLRLYSEIDERAKILGFVMKKFAKLCNIGDASRGSLSSYAYILIVIYFLQQCKPPVLPVLQEIEKQNATTEDIVSNCNTYFYSDIQNLHLKWPEYGKNCSSVGKLWLELLKFYSEEFDFENYVISIRRKSPLLRFEKLWKSKHIKIEDPFDINHNLGSALSRNMHNFILNTFRKGRNHFGTAAEISVCNMSVVALESFFFNPKYLTPGKVPADKICRLCKKIGHMAKSCHLRNPSTDQFTEKTNHEDRRWANGDRLNSATFQRPKGISHPKETNYVETRVFANKSYVHEMYEHHPFNKQGQRRGDRSDLTSRNSGNVSHAQRRAANFRSGKVDPTNALPTRNIEFPNRGFYTQVEQVEFRPVMYRREQLAAANALEKKFENLEIACGRKVAFERKKPFRHNNMNINRLQPSDCDGETSNSSVSTPVVDIKVPT